MKKFDFLLIAITISLSVHAQYQKQWRISQGYDFRFQPGFFAMNISGEYFPVHYLSVSPSVSVYLPATGKATGVNLDARYYLTEKKYQWYASSGYGYYKRVFELSENPPVNLHTFNVGTGLQWKLLDQLGLNPEIQRQFGQRSTWTVKLGIVYFIN
jgi:hypothetical protein